MSGPALRKRTGPGSPSEGTTRSERGDPRGTASDDPLVQPLDEPLDDPLVEPLVGRPVEQDDPNGQLDLTGEAQGPGVFDADETDEVVTELTIGDLDWKRVTWERSNEPDWSRSGSEYVLQSSVVGFRYRAFDPSGEDIHAGWRPTRDAAKKAAKRHIRRASKRRRRARG
jgi:hypothetical protein